MRNTVLPLRIQERLNQMFARDTGFSGPQILDFFSRYDINIESYPVSGAPSRKQMFEDCLARFDRETQLRIVSDLLDYDGPFKHNAAGVGERGLCAQLVDQPGCDFGGDRRRVWWDTVYYNTQRRTRNPSRWSGMGRVPISCVRGQRRVRACTSTGAQRPGPSRLVR
jgi:hypothetical protein